MAAYTKIVLIAVCFLAALALAHAQYGLQGSLSPNQAGYSGSLGGGSSQGSYQGSQSGFQGSQGSYQQGSQGSYQGSSQGNYGRPQGSAGYQGSAYGK